MNVRTERNIVGMENGFVINMAVLIEYLHAYLYIYFAHSVFCPLPLDSCTFSLITSNLLLKYDLFIYKTYKNIYTHT